ncbi:MAG: hypothetical protein ACHQQQ_14685 [Bacteroidota bacterium]
MNKRSEIFYSLLYATLICGIGIFSFLRPYYNWDLLGYVGTTLSIEEHNAEILHQKTYTYVKNSIPEQNYASLIANDNSYRTLTATDPKFFAEQLHYYTIRPLYIAMLFILYKMGMNIVQATLAISIISCALVCTLVRIWLLKYTVGIANLVSCSLLVMVSGILEAARLSTPDALSAVFILAGTYLFIEKRKFLPAWICFLLSTATRVDNVIFIIIYAVYFRYFSAEEIRRGKKLFTYLITSSLLLSAGILYVFGGHSPEFFFPNNYHWQEQAAPHSMILRIVTNYLVSTAVSIKQVVFDGYSNAVLLFVGLGMLNLYHVYRKNAENNLLQQLSFIALLAIAGRLLVFPVVANRFFIPYYIMIGIAFAADQFRRPQPAETLNAIS